MFSGKMLIWCFDILVVMVAVCPLSRARIVKTLNGDIEGFSDVIDGVTVDIFLGIPFAKPPIGDLRFRYLFNFLFDSHIHPFLF